MNYDKVYLQKEADGAEVMETVAAFGIYCAEMPFTVANKAKELTTRDWKDEHGLDTYIPQDGLKLSDYEMSVKFCCKGDKNTSNAKIKAFLTYLLGGYLKIWCSLTRIGRQHVRFVELSDDAELVRDDDGDILVFTVKFNVDDPSTFIVPEDSNITNLVASGS